MGTNKALTQVPKMECWFSGTKHPDKTIICDQVTWSKIHPSTFSGVFFQMTGGKTAPAVKLPPDLLMEPALPILQSP